MASKEHFSNNVFLAPGVIRSGGLQLGDDSGSVADSDQLAFSSQLNKAGEWPRVLSETTTTSEGPKVCADTIVAKNPKLIPIFQPRPWKWIKRIGGVTLLFLIMRLCLRIRRFFSGGGNYLVGIELNPGPRGKNSSTTTTTTSTSSSDGKDKERSRSRKPKKGGKKGGGGRNERVIESLIDENAKLKAQIDQAGKKTQEVSEAAEIKAELEVRALRRELDEDDNLNSPKLPFIPPSGGVPTIGIGAISSHRIALINRLDMNVCPPYSIVLGELPRALWPAYIPALKMFLRTGFVPQVMNFFDAWDPYELLARVELVAIPFARTRTAGVVPWRDQGLPARDDHVIHYQPMLKIVCSDGGFVWKSVDYNSKLGDPAGGLFTPRPSIDVIKEGQYFARVRIEEDPSLGLAFESLTVSEYLLTELYSRRIILAPKLSTATSVERLIRFAAEDCLTSAQPEFLAQNKNVLRHTVSFLTGVVSKDMTTALEDF